MEKLIKEYQKIYEKMIYKMENSLILKINENKEKY